MTDDDWERTAAILGDVATDLGAQLELVRAELADVRSDLAVVEQERDELRGAIHTHRAAVFAQIGRYGSKFDRALWSELDR